MKKEIKRIIFILVVFLSLSKYGLSYEKNSIKVAENLKNYVLVRLDNELNVQALCEQANKMVGDKSTKIIYNSKESKIDVYKLGDQPQLVLTADIIR